MGGKRKDGWSPTYARAIVGVQDLISLAHRARARAGTELAALSAKIDAIKAELELEVDCSGLTTSAAADKLVAAGAAAFDDALVVEAWQRMMPSFLEDQKAVNRGKLSETCIHANAR